MEEHLQFNGFDWKPLFTEKLIKTLIYSLDADFYCLNVADPG